MLYQQLIYSNKDLAPGSNTIRLVVNGNTNSDANDSFVHIDKFVYTVSSPIVSGGGPTANNSLLIIVLGIVALAVVICGTIIIVKRISIKA